MRATIGFGANDVVTSQGSWRQLIATGECVLYVGDVGLSLLEMHTRWLFFPTIFPRFERTDSKDHHFQVSTAPKCMKL